MTCESTSFHFHEIKSFDETISELCMAQKSKIVRHVSSICTISMYLFSNMTLLQKGQFEKMAWTANVPVYA